MEIFTRCNINIFIRWMLLSTLTSCNDPITFWESCTASESIIYSESVTSSSELLVMFIHYFVARKNLLGRPGNNSSSPRTNVPRLTILVVTNNGLMYLSNNFLGIMYSFRIPYLVWECFVHFRIARPVYDVFCP